MIKQCKLFSFVSRIQKFKEKGPNNLTCQVRDLNHEFKNMLRTTCQESGESVVFILAILGPLIEE